MAAGFKFRHSKANALDHEAFGLLIIITENHLSDTVLTVLIKLLNLIPITIPKHREVE